MLAPVARATRAAISIIDVDLLCPFSRKAMQGAEAKATDYKIRLDLYKTNSADYWYQFGVRELNRAP